MTATTLSPILRKHHRERSGCRDVVQPEHVSSKEFGSQVKDITSTSKSTDCKLAASPFLVDCFLPFPTADPLPSTLASPFLALASAHSAGFLTTSLAQSRVVLFGGSVGKAKVVLIAENGVERLLCNIANLGITIKNAEAEVKFEKKKVCSSCPTGNSGFATTSGLGEHESM